MKQFYGFFVLAFVILASCSTNVKERMTTSKQMKPLDTSNMSLSVDPGKDFYRYANGQWMKNNPIPDDKARYGSFDELQESNNEKIRELIKELSAQEAEEGSLTQKIRDFYNSGMDTTRINELGYAPVKPYLEQINAVTSIEDLFSLAGNLQSKGVSYLFSMYAGQDRKNSEMMIANLYQNGLSMPDRSYYLSDDDRSKELRTAFRSHVKAMFELIAVEPDKADAYANNVLNLETALAEISMSRKDRRDPHKTYHKMPLQELHEMTPNISWEAFLPEYGVETPEDLNVAQPDFMKGLNTMLEEYTLEDWKTLLTWKVIDRAAAYLSDDFVNQNFAFYGKVLSGKQEMEPRWKRALNTTSKGMGMALGKMYVNKYFPPEAKARVEELVANLKKAYKSRIRNVSWMTDATKEKALEKLDAMTVKVGYPDEWRDYSDLDIAPGKYFENVLQASAFNIDYNLDKIGKKADPKEWHMTPQTVNAYYNPANNEIVFPAAILQPPFFFQHGDDAVNYGAIGVVIGHEMTHGFDDKGRLFDKNGNLNEWWTEEDSREFNKRAEQLVAHFGDFVPIKDMHLDGELTLGENIADNGGLHIALDALHLSLKDMDAQKIDGFTPEQRFFLSYAQIWRQNIRDEELMRRLKEDVHSPGEYRVNGGVFNVDAFYNAFSEVSASDRLYRAPEKRADIW